MFESAVLQIAPSQRRRNAVVLPLAVLTHVLVVGTVLTVQLLAVEELPPPQEMVHAVIVPAPPPPQGPPAPAPGGEHQRPRREPLAQPRAVPEDAPALLERSAAADGVGVEGGLPREGGDAGGNGDGEAAVPTAAGPVGPPEPLVMQIGGEVVPPVAIKRVRPIYPPAARHAGRQGAVRVRAVVDMTGLVTAVEVIDDGIGFGCGDAAAAAIRQWRFRPATLRGRPVSVFMEITVTFTLARS